MGHDSSKNLRLVPNGIIHNPNAPAGPAGEGSICASWLKGLLPIPSGLSDASLTDGKLILFHYQVQEVFKIHSSTSYATLTASP